MTTTYRVEERPEVVADYFAIAEHIIKWTDDPAGARRRVARIRAFVRGLKDTPYRGTMRDDLRPGLRIVPFEKRAAIAFEIDDESRTVTVLRVFYGGQDYEAVLHRP